MLVTRASDASYQWHVCECYNDSGSLTVIEGTSTLFKKKHQRIGGHIHVNNFWWSCNVLSLQLRGGLWRILIWHLSDICVYFFYFRRFVLGCKRRLFQQNLQYDHSYRLSSAWKALRRYLIWKPVILQRLTKNARKWRRKFHVHVIWPDGRWEFAWAWLLLSRRWDANRAGAS